MPFFITRYRKRPIISKDENVPVELTGSTSRSTSMAGTGLGDGGFLEKRLHCHSP